MKRSTHYAIMFFVACSLTGIAINGNKLYGWALTLDACSVLLGGAFFLFFLAFVGKREISNEEKMEQKLHDDRKERVRWMIEPVIERRKKELMQNKPTGERK